MPPAMMPSTAAVAVPTSTAKAGDWAGKGIDSQISLPNQNGKLIVPYLAT